MILPARLSVIRRVGEYAWLISARTASKALDPWLVCGVVCQESAGNPGALRVERGFWTRYKDGIIRNIKATASKLDDPWLAYPDLVAASWGLMQCMYEVAIERGMELQYPAELADPAVGLEAGCRQLAYCFTAIGAYALDDRANEDAVRNALQRYNGGGDPNYAMRVREWRADALAAQLFRFP